MRWSWIVIAAALAASGCQLLGAEADASECPRVGERAPAAVALDVWITDAMQSRLTFDAVLDAGRCSRVVVPADLERIESGRYRGGPFVTGSSGVLHATCAISDGRGNRVRAEASLPLRDDWRHDLLCAAGTDNPYSLCFGCAGYAAAPLAPLAGMASSDTLFLVWSGQSISNPVRY